MGRAKELLQEQQDQGWNFVADDRFVCDECLPDPALQEFIRKRATDRKCTYCGTNGNENIAAPTNEVLKLIGEGFFAEYDTAENAGVPYCSGEGGYQFHVMDTDDLLEHVGFETANDLIRNEISTAFADNLWIERDWLRLEEHEALILSWQIFTEMVKRETRYVFALLPKKAADADDECLAPGEMLVLISQFIRDFGLVRTMRAGSTWHRGRTHKPGERPSSAAELGTTPSEKALSANRNSPAGIPMFYGAEDEATAVVEIRGHRKKGESVVTIGAFELVNDIEVVNLCDVPEVPSLFDAIERHSRPALRFLRDFVAELSKPVKLDGREHIEYVPTQIVTEYLRRVFRTATSQSVSGVLYPSSHNKKRCCTLFFKNGECGVARRKGCAEKENQLKLMRVRRRKL